jgi:hypothetical protein
MFRTSNNRGQARFDFIEKLRANKTGRIELSPKQISLIENSTKLRLAEKIELFLVAMGNKLTTELYMKIDYKWDQKRGIEVANKADLELIEQLLDQLPFVYFTDHLPKKNPQNGKTQNFTWYQVSINKTVSEFMEKYPDDLTEFEEGVLYGFPLSAIRAFSRLIDARHDTPNPATYYLAGWCSADFWDDEQLYYQLWWNRLKKLSPKTVNQAEVKFNKENPSRATSI